MKNKRIGLYIFIFIVLLLVLLLFFYQWNKIISIIKLVFFSGVFAYVLAPAVQWLEKRMPPALAILILFGILLTFLTIFFMLLIPVILKESAALIEKIPNLTEDIQNFLVNAQKRLEKLGLPYCIQQSLNKYVIDIQENLINSFEGLLNRIIDSAGRIPELFMIPVLGFYFIKDREHFKRLSISLTPHSSRSTILKMSLELHQILNQFIRSQILISLVVGTLAAFGFWVVGMPYALILGLFCGIFEIIPYFGPWLGAVPAVLLAFINMPSKVFWAVLVVILVQQLEGSVITPKIMSDQVELRPVYVILSIWAGGLFFGIIGMLFAVPVILILRVIFKHLFTNLIAPQ